MRKLWKILTIGSALVLSLGEIPLLTYAEGEETSFGARNITQKSRIRYNATDESKLTGTDLGTNYQYGTIPALSSPNASFVRLLLHVEEAGLYSIGVKRSSADYKINLYVNGDLVAENYDLGSTNWALVRTDHQVPLQAGNNVVILQINNWGGITDFIFPNQISVIQHDESDGIYYTVDAKLNSTVISVADSSTQTIHDFDAAVIPNPFTYVTKDNGDPDWDYMGYAEFNIQPKATTKSLKIHYSSSDFSTGNYTGIMMAINNGEHHFIPLPTGEVNQPLEHVVEVGMYGFNFAEENQVLIYNDARNSNKLRVTALSLSEEGTLTVPHGAEELKGKVQLRGRQFAKDEAIVMDWSASGFDVNVSGSRVIDAVFTAPNGARIATSVNHQPATLTTVSPGTSKVRLVQGLNPEETAHIRIYKASEAAGSLCELISLDLEEGATLTKPEDKNLKFFFLGSSTSCGNQIEPDGSIDAYGAFPRVIADAFDADFDVVSCSGRGLMEGYNSEDNWAMSQDHQLKELFDKTSYFRDPEANYNHSLKDYDVIVLSIGHNDLGAAIMEHFGTSISDFTAEVKTFHAKVRTLYPHAYILYEYGHYKNREFNQEFNAAIAELQADDAHTDYVYTPLYAGGAAEHPSYAQHESIAKALTPFIANALQVENPLGPVPVRYEAERALCFGNPTAEVDENLDSPWSERSYVGNLEATTAIIDPNMIKGDGSDVTILKFYFHAEESGRYRFSVAYATQVAHATAYVRFNGRSWIHLDLHDTYGWKTVQESAFIEVNLASGTHAIELTGVCELGTWVNYDYIEMTRLGEAETCHIHRPDDPRVSIIGVADEVIAGEDIAFQVNVHEEYTQSEIVVKVNNQIIIPEAGLFSVKNVETDLYITVEGLRKNVFTLTFKDGEEILSEVRYEVGASVTVPEDPIKEGYTFNGWDRPIPETMPNGDLVINATWVEAPSSSQDTNNTWVIIGVTLGGIAILGTGGGIAFYFVKKKRRICVKK